MRDLQDRTGGFTAWIPWTFQKENTVLDGKVEEAGGFEYLKTLAVSRLYLDNIRHVQGSWVTQGPKIGQVSLSFGADDLGSIMIEENVVYAAGARNRMTQEEMRRLIADAGYDPRPAPHPLRRLQGILLHEPDPRAEGAGSAAPRRRLRPRQQPRLRLARTALSAVGAGRAPPASVGSRACETAKGPFSTVDGSPRGRCGWQPRLVRLDE